VLRNGLWVLVRFQWIRAAGCSWFLSCWGCWALLRNILRTMRVVIWLLGDAIPVQRWVERGERSRVGPSVGSVRDLPELDTLHTNKESGLVSTHRPTS
jgi:hypothetical protein